MFTSLMQAARCYGFLLNGQWFRQNNKPNMKHIKCFVAFSTESYQINNIYNIYIFNNWYLSLIIVIQILFYFINFNFNKKY